MKRGASSVEDQCRLLVVLVALIIHRKGNWKSLIQPLAIIACDSRIFAYSEAGNVDSVRDLLLANQASPDDCDSRGYTALHRAVILRNYDLCLLLLRVGANPNAITFRGETPLHVIPKNRSRDAAWKLDDIVKLLIQSGSDPTIEDYSHRDAIQAFNGFYHWPSRDSLSHDISQCFLWLKTPGERKQLSPKTSNGRDVTTQVKILDDCLRADSDFKQCQLSINAKCQLSIDTEYTPLHLMMDFRIEPYRLPGLEGSIFQQKRLWVQALSRALHQGVDPHAVNKEGETVTSLALRSFFTFIIWRDALVAHDYNLGEFVRREPSQCSTNLRFLFNIPTEKLHFNAASWWEEPILVHSAEDEEAEIFSSSTWIQLLDVVKYRCLLPLGWQVIAYPRQFGLLREAIYWNKSQGRLVGDRPSGGRAIDLSRFEFEDVIEGLAV